jgi:hypothetical protein
MLSLNSLQSYSTAVRTSTQLLYEPRSSCMSPEHNYKYEYKYDLSIVPLHLIRNRYVY